MGPPGFRDGRKDSRGRHTACPEYDPAAGTVGRETRADEGASAVSCKSWGVETGVRGAEGEDGEEGGEE